MKRCKWMFPLLIASLFITGCSLIDEVVNDVPDIEITEEQPAVASEVAVSKFSGETYEDLPKEQLITVQFSQHVDGDTTWFLINNQKVKVRYLLIDTPETVKVGVDLQPFGQEASDRTKQLLSEAGRIELMLDKGEPLDAYGRLLAYIFVDDQLVQDVLIREGLARVAYANNPSTTYLQQLQESQKIAKNEELGIWEVPGYVTEDGFLNK